MATRDIIVIGASAGGLEAMRTLVGQLPHNLPATILIVWHISPDSPSLLPEILSKSGPLSASNPRDTEEIRHGRIYVAPPDHHLILEPGRVRLTRGPKENRFRPAVDPLFRSAAEAYGPRVIGVILTGNLDDGTAGLWAVKERGGLAIVQDPNEALCPSMPRSALQKVQIDYCLPVAEIGHSLAHLVTEPIAEKGERPVPEEMKIETKIAREDNALEAGVMRLGVPSTFSCPECHGVLLQLKNEGILRFRCHTGHAYSVNTLLSEISEKVEDELWSVIRAMDETLMLMRHIGQHLRDQNDPEAAELFLQKARETEQRTQLVRQAVLNHEKFSEEMAGKGHA
jgi:two-component system chemotaxis response regulator CheB